MATEDWPASLPQDLRRSSYRQALKDNVERFQPDTGPAKRRPRFTSETRPLRGDVVLNPTQLDTLRDFYEDNLGFGNVAFNFPDPLSVGTLEVKFLTPPAWRPFRGATVIVALDLEIQP